MKNSVAEISMRVQSKGRYGQPVNQKVYHRSKKLLDYLRFRRVKQARTTGIYFFSIYRFNPPRVVGYQARNTLTFQVPVSRVASILRGAFDNIRYDAKIIRVAFKSGEKQVEDARKEALREAVMAARMDAMNLGVQVGPPLRVRVTHSSLPLDTAVPTSTSNLRKKLSKQINVGVTNIEARVEITYRVSKRNQGQGIETGEEYGKE